MTQPGMFSQSDGYEMFMGRWSRRLAPLLVSFAHVGEGDAVLDVGCGTGALAFAAGAIPSVRVTGVDPSSAYIEAARERLGNDRARFEVGDGAALGFPGSSFDRALSLLVLNFMADPSAAVREMVRVTRPDGVVAAAVWDYGDGMQMLRVFWDEAVGCDPSASQRDERKMPLSRSGELTTLFRDAGLDSVEEWPLTIEMPFTSFADYWEPFLCGQGPAGAYMTSLSESASQSLQFRLRERLLGGRPDRAFTLTARAWAARGLVPNR